MAVSTRDRAIHILDALPAEKLDEALRMLQELVEPRYTLEDAGSAPVDDEAETEQERLEVMEARAGRARGESISLDEWLSRRGA